MVKIKLAPGTIVTQINKNQNIEAIEVLGDKKYLVVETKELTNIKDKERVYMLLN